MTLTVKKITAQLLINHDVNITQSQERPIIFNPSHQLFTAWPQESCPPPVCWSYTTQWYVFLSHCAVAMTGWEHKRRCKQQHFRWNGIQRKGIHTFKWSNVSHILRNTVNCQNPSKWWLAAPWYDAPRGVFWECWQPAQSVRKVAALAAMFWSELNANNVLPVSTERVLWWPTDRKTCGWAPAVQQCHFCFVCKTCLRVSGHFGAVIVINVPRVL